MNKANRLVSAAKLGIALLVQRNSALDVFLSADASQEGTKELCNGATVSLLRGFFSGQILPKRGSSGFLVGTYDILCSALWGTSPPDPLGFIALEARAAP